MDVDTKAAREPRGLRELAPDERGRSGGWCLTPLLQGQVCWRGQSAEPPELVKGPGG